MVDGNVTSSHKLPLASHLLNIGSYAIYSATTAHIKSHNYIQDSYYLPDPVYFDNGAKTNICQFSYENLAAPV